MAHAAALHRQAHRCHSRHSARPNRRSAHQEALRRSAHREALRRSEVVRHREVRLHQGVAVALARADNICEVSPTDVTDLHR